MAERCPEGSKRVGLLNCHLLSCRSNAQKVVQPARDETEKIYPGPGMGDRNGPKDAMRHCIASCMVTQKVSEDCAWFAGTLREYAPGSDQYPGDEREMDLHNNAVGRECGRDCKTSCADCCKKKRDNWELEWFPEDRWID